MADFSTIDKILKAYGRKKFKHTKDGLVAVQGQWSWHYFRYDDKAQNYLLTGTTEKYQD